MNPYIDLHLLSDNKFLDKIQNHPIKNIILNILEKRKMKKNKINILEFGSGHGDISLSLAYHVNNVIGIDISIKMIEYSNLIKKRLHCLDSNIEKKNNVIFSKKLSNVFSMKINVIIAINSMHFVAINKIEETIKIFLSKISKDGLIIIQEPTKKSKFAKLTDIKKKKQKFKNLKETEKKLDEVLFSLSLKNNIMYKKLYYNLTNLYLIFNNESQNT